MDWLSTEKDLSIGLDPPPPLNVRCCRIFKVYICQGKNQKSAGPLIIALKQIGIFNHENYFKFLYVEFEIEISHGNML